MDSFLSVWKEIAGVSVITLTLFALINYNEFKSMFLSYWNASSNSANDFFSLMLNEQDKPPAPMEKVEKVAGVGSIWNNNNWFYEEKNYSNFAKEYLTDEMI